MRISDWSSDRVLFRSTIADDLFDDYRGTMDFIQAYIFPGGMLLPPAAIAAQGAAAGLAVTDSFSFGADYARTLCEWRQRFEAAWPDIREMGFDDRFHIGRAHV